MAKNEPRRGERLPAIAIISGAIGLVLTAGLVGFIGWEALRAPRAAPTPRLAVEAVSTHRTPGGYLVEFEARNGSPRTAAAVQIEATLEVAGAEPVTSTVSLDYVPGNSSQRGGVVMPADPRAGRLTLRVAGYSEP